MEMFKRFVELWEQTSKWARFSIIVIVLTAGLFVIGSMITPSIHTSTYRITTPQQDPLSAKFQSALGTSFDSCSFREGIITVTFTDPIVFDSDRGATSRFNEKLEKILRIAQNIRLPYKQITIIYMCDFTDKYGVVTHQKTVIASFLSNTISRINLSNSQINLYALADNRWIEPVVEYYLRTGAFENY